MRYLKQYSARLLALLLTVCVLTGCAGAAQSSADAAASGIQTETTAYFAVKNEAQTVSAAAQQTQTGKQSGRHAAEDTEQQAEDTVRVQEDGQYTSKEEVAAYLHRYGRLPSNFITKKEAERLGWESREGNLGEVAPGMSIGGDHFGNYEGSLPEKKGRKYRECDIDTDGSFRGAKRIIYSNDGLIYYTEDHYESFELLYGEE